MKIFLGNAPWLDKDNPTKYGVRAGSRWPHFQNKDPVTHTRKYIPFPHFLASSAAVLQNAGIETLLVDGIAEGDSVEAFINKIKGFSPDLVLLEVSTPSIAYDLDIAQKIKAICGNTKIAFSGIHAPMKSEEFFNRYPVIDFVLFGEYEYTIKELAINFLNINTYKDIQGLVFRDTAGTIKINEKRPLIANLDELPFYAYHFLPMHNYSDTPCGLPAPSVQMWTSRGCPFKCSFCAWPQIMYSGNSYRTRSINRILDELEFLIKKYHFKSFYFDDDTVNINKDRMFELCLEIKKREINLPWSIMARADTMDIELLKKLKSSGLYSLKYGVESGEQTLIDRSGKNLNLEKVKENVQLTKKIGIKVHLTFTFGLPGETKESIKKTIALALELAPDAVQFSLLTPFPGSKYYDEAKRDGLLITTDYSKFNGSSYAVVKTETLSGKELEEGLRLAYQAWHEYRYKKINSAYLPL